MILYDQSKFYVDFSNRTNLTDAEKLALETIQKTYRPVERVVYLIEYRVQNKITADDYETMTSLHYDFAQ